MKYLIAAIALVVFATFINPAQAHTPHHSGDRVKTEMLVQELHRMQNELERLRFEMEMLRGDVMSNRPPVIPLYRPAR